MPKNIIIFSDGTGQEGGAGNNTNIYKIFNIIEDRTRDQIAFYDPGLGTGWNKLTGNIGGMGISRNIQQCYRFLLDNFESGDSIFLFGFSRGATTVRSLSSLIHHFGVLPRSRPELIEQAYAIYRTSDKAKVDAKAKDFVARHHTMWTRVKFLGCFDTVAALGLPWKWASALLDGLPGFRHEFHDLKLSASVENAFQALAIDDERKTFQPILWDEVALPYQSIRQVWFMGMHTDVGGGYKEQNISDIPFVWLVQKAVDKGLRIYSGNQVHVAEDADGVIHDSRGSVLSKLYRKKVRSWNRTRKNLPIIHESAFKRTKGPSNDRTHQYQPWIFAEKHEIEKWVPYGNQSWHAERGVTNRGEL